MPLTTSDEWRSVLQLATQWQFHALRSAAIGELDALALSPVDKIALAMQHDVTSWVKDALIDIVVRTEPLRMGECDKLGMAWVVKIAAVRERLAVLRERESHPAPCPMAPPAANMCPPYPPSAKLPVQGGPDPFRSVAIQELLKEFRGEPDFDRLYRDY